MMERLTKTGPIMSAWFLRDNDPIATLHMTEIEKQRVLDRLAAYEDTGLTPEEIALALPKFDDVQDAKKHAVRLREIYGEWYNWKQADADGRLIVLPCKVGSTVFKITRHRVDVSGYRMEWEFETMIEPVKFTIGMTGAIGKTVFLSREEAERYEV